MLVGMQSFAPNWRKVKVAQGTNPRREARDEERARDDTFQIRRCASQTKPMQECHPERSEGSLSSERSFAALRMTKRDGLVFEMYWGQKTRTILYMSLASRFSVYSRGVPLRSPLEWWLFYQEVRSLYS